MTVPHPWRGLRALAHIVVHYARLPSLGFTDGERVIWLDSRLLQVERRCTLAHELAHIRRERAVERDAARYLLPDIHRVADAIVWSVGRLEEAADELWVDVPMLEARLSGLHPSERAVIERRVSHGP